MKINESAGWIAMWNGKKCEIKKDEAKDLWGAKQLAIKKLGVPKSRVGELAIDVAFEDDEDGVSNAQFEDLKESAYDRDNLEDALKELGFESNDGCWYTYKGTGVFGEIVNRLQNKFGKFDYVDEPKSLIKIKCEESLDEAKDIEVKDIEKMAELEPGDEVEVTKEMDDVFDKSLEMAKEFDEEPKLETFDEQMDFLAADEQEAIDGYEKVIALVEDEHVKEQLDKILVEEKAHKEFLEKVKEDKSLEYSHEEKEEEPVDELPVEAEVIDDIEIEPIELESVEQKEVKQETLVESEDDFEDEEDLDDIEDEEEQEYEVSKEVAARIKTVKDLNDFFAYVERFGDEFSYTWPEEEQDRIDELMDDMNYEPGEYNSKNVARILDIKEECEELLGEDTIKQGNHWVNKGDEGTHGKFKTKKEADAQRKAMFANGYHEDYDDDFGFNHVLEEEHKEEAIDWNDLDPEFEKVVMGADDDVLDDVYGKDTLERKLIRGARDIKKGLEKTEEKHVCEKCGKEVCECDKKIEEEHAHTGHIKAKKPIELLARVEK